MSMFERDEFKWRETYFVLFDSCKRPSLKHVERALHRLSDRFQFTNGVADDDGRFESITVLSPDDYAALDISYMSGDEVLEQVQILHTEMTSSQMEPEDREKLTRLSKCDGRFDLLHFEQITAAAGPEDESEEMLDPSALLIVLDALVDLTDGVGVDPQSGTLL